MIRDFFGICLMIVSLSACNAGTENRTAKLYSGTGGGWYFTKMTSQCANGASRCFE